MTLQKYLFKPGINKENTRYANEGGWWNMQWVRFRSGSPEKMGGWQQAISSPFSGVCRKLFNWIDLTNNNLMALGTNLKLYVERGSGIFDVTPVVNTETVANPIWTTTGSTTVRVDFTNHDANVGDYITISGVSGSVGGIPESEFNAEFIVTAIPSANYFTIQTTTAATSTVNGGGGASVTVDILLPSGNEYAVSGTGWGAGTWGRSTWGSGVSTAATSPNQIRLWSFDNFGENLVANPRGLEIYYWQPRNGYATANRAVPLSSLSGASDTPLSCNYVISTDERHVVAFGTNVIGDTAQDPLLIRWSDQEDPAMWTPAATNSAGDMRVPLGSVILAAEPTRQETLVFTDASVHSFQYIGAPYTFSLQTLSTNSSLVGPNAIATVNSVTYWMGTDKFYAYSGRVETLPCSLRRFIYSDINLDQSYQFHAGLNEQFGEIVWYYCSANAVVIDRYVIFNYLENIWYYGACCRTTWIDSNTRGAPFATGYDGYMYQQEFGCDDGSTNPPSAIPAYIESADFDIDDGDKFSFIKRIIPDVTFQNSTSSTPSIMYTLSARNFPGATFDESNTRSVTAVTNQVDQYTNQVWTRVRGRQASIRIESTGVGVMWQAGSTRFDIRPDGRR
jgi:hypothetical protein